METECSSVLYSFTVLSYTADYLQLQCLWGDEIREWIFTAGVGNFCGLVLDQADVVVEEPYNYYGPIANATVEFGTFNEEIFVGSGMTTTTNAEGFFTLTGLSPTYDEKWAGVRVSADGYATYTMTFHESMQANLRVYGSNQLYSTVFLGP